MRKFLDKFSLYWDFTNGAGSLGKAHPVKPVVRDLQGDFASVVRNSPKNLTQKTGLIGSIPANTIPYRWDGNRFGAFVEPSAQNLLLRSEEFNQSVWAKVNINASGTPPFINVATAPDGTLTADKLIASTALGQHRLDYTTSTASLVHTFSVWAKADEYTIISLRMGARSSAFNLANGVSGATEALTTARIVAFPNGFYRVSISGDSGLNAVCRINIENSVSVGSSFSGDDTSGIFLWGAQLETGSVATSYIKTEGSAQTRNADVITLSNIPDLIGQTQGFIYAEVNTTITSQTAKIIFQLHDGSATNQFDIRVSSNSRFTSLIQSGNFTTISTSTEPNFSGLSKLLVVYQRGFVSFWVNGVKIAENATFTSFSNTISNIEIGRDRSANSAVYLNDTIYRVGIGKEILSDEEAIFMTTL
jgi:hypothetical protein